MWLVVAWGLAHAGSARAQTVTVADVYAEPDVRDEAGAVTLLVRSALRVGRDAVTSRAALAEALEQVDGVRPRRLLVVPGAVVAKVLRHVGAQYLVAAELQRRGTRLVVTVRVYGSAGETLAIARADARDGDVSGAASAAVAIVTRAAGVSARRVAHASVGQLRPFTRAGQALAPGVARGGALARGSRSAGGGPGGGGA